MSDFLSRITHPDVQQFIFDEELTDVRELVLRHKEILGVPSSWIATQISGRRKAKTKLPLWYQTRGIIFPPSINLEQCSSETTARFKQSLVNGNACADLTTGFGVDSFFLSRVVSQLDSVEPDEALSVITQHNLQLLGAKNITYHNTTAEKHAGSNSPGYDFLFVDPSRRVKSKKVFRLSDSLPDVVAMERAFLERAPVLILKTSPLLDLKQAYRELGSIDQFMVLAHENECKEVILILRRERENNEPPIHAVNLEKDGTATTLISSWSQEKSAEVAFGEPRKYLYEPNAAILKAGAFRNVGQLYGLTKLAADSHLYTSDKMCKNFPGRVFEIRGVVSLSRDLRKKFERGQANIIVRNFPQSIEQVKKQTGLSDGGEDYLICTRASRPIALVAKRIS